MNIAQTKEALRALWSNDACPPAFLSGPPGVGKTATVSQVAADMGLALITIALPTCESVDLRGLPVIVGGATTWASPLPKDGEGVLLLDEISSAPRDVQVAAHHLLHAERGSDMCMPVGWRVACTGNRAVDRSTYIPLSAPLRNRLTYIEVQADVEEWAAWSQRQNLHPALIGFLRWRPNLLTTAKPPDEGPFSSPRSWHSCSSILKLSVSALVERALLAGTVGEGAATELAAYMLTYRELPTARAIMQNPKKAEVPTSPSILYALVTALAQYTVIEQSSAMQYVRRLPAEFIRLYLGDVKDRWSLRDDPAVVDWIDKHPEAFAYGRQ